MTPAILLLAVLTAAKAYPDIRRDRPAWELRAELLTMAVMVAVVGVVLVGLAAAGLVGDVDPSSVRFESGLVKGWPSA